ncbi:methionyl-tRNA formyltransferase [Clostridium sp. CAG:678]|nr:methionyl-tRNA formyltransferase [Clostridium sp. CAG:678]
MRIVFMGTPDYAVPSLQKLIDEHYEIAGVFTQPDKKVGRKQILTPSAVKELAERYELPVYQPQTLKDGSAYEILKSIAPDMIIVAAYGKILPKSILDLPKYGCVNVHASLLPKYRGAAPIQRAVLNGDEETGISIMQMDEGIDTGDLLYIVKTKIGINETSAELFDRLSVLGAEALIHTVKNIENGSAAAYKQEGESSYASMIDKSMSPIDWNRTAFEIHNQIRGLQTWPCAQTVICGKPVKIHASVLSDVSGGRAGEVIHSGKELIVSCGDGKCISVTRVQPAGKSKMDIRAFLAGNPVKPGTILGV